MPLITYTHYKVLYLTGSKSALKFRKLTFNKFPKILYSVRT